MKNIIFIIPLSILLFSCTSYNESKNLNTEKAKLAHSKFMNLNNKILFALFIVAISFVIYSSFN